MSLSVIKIGAYESGLYCSDSKTFLYKGSEDAMYKTKDVIETTEQQLANKKHLANLRAEYKTLLIKGGMTEDRAEIYLNNSLNF